MIIRKTTFHYFFPSPRGSIAVIPPSFWSIYIVKFDGFAGEPRRAQIRPGPSFCAMHCQFGRRHKLVLCVRKFTSQFLNCPFDRYHTSSFISEPPEIAVFDFFSPNNRNLIQSLLIFCKTNVVGVRPCNSVVYINLAVQAHSTCRVCL